MAGEREMITRIFEEITRGNVDALDEYFDESYVDHGPGIELRGRDAFKDSVRQWLGAFSERRVEVSNIIVEGDNAAWLVHFTGKHTGDTLGFPATGRSVDVVSASIGRMRDGKAVEHWSEQGLLETLQQLGVIPQMGPPQPVS